MADETELATHNRRLTVIEKEVDGERIVSRHILRKVTEIENTLLSMQNTLATIQEQFTIMRADQPRIVGDIVSATMREEFSKRSKID
jgi:hypothetical protein